MHVKDANGPPNVLPANPAITFLAADKIIGHLLGSFPAWDLNPIPPSIVVIDEDMRTGTFNSRLCFESHSVAVRCVADLSGHLAFLEKAENPGADSVLGIRGPLCTTIGPSGNRELRLIGAAQRVLPPSGQR